MTIGEIVIFTEYARQFTRPLNDLANQFNTVLSAIAGAERVFSIMDEPAEVDAANENKDYQLKGNVTFEHVTFRYNKEDETPTIQDVSFHVEAGKTASISWGNWSR